MPIGLIIFDCDGVLIDSEVLSFRVLLDSLANYGIELTLAEAMQRYLGMSSASGKADIETRYKIKLTPEYFEKKRLRRIKIFEAELQAMPAVSDLIESLSLKKCIASSSSPERLKHSLEVVGLWHRFAPHIFSAEQVKNGKPAPDLFLYAAEKMGASPLVCLVIEDSIAGVRAAKAAGMKVYGFTGGSHCDKEHGQRLLDEGAEAVFVHMDDVGKALATLT